MRPLVYFFFFASGACALIYEVAWVRILTVEFGTTVYAISAVLTVFMAGLALGGYLFGRWIDRGANPLWIYGGMELALGAYAVMFVVVMPHLHRLSVWLLQGSVLPHTYSSLIKFLLAVAVLLPPTTLMGGTLPVLAKYVTESAKRAGMRLGMLYGMNTLGAVFGCLAEAYLLILLLGVNGSILLAAAINGFLGVVSGILSFFVNPPRIDDAAPLREGELQGIFGSRPANRSMLLLQGIAFSSGFVTLAAEVLWTRLFINLLSSNVLIFATILAAFLSGIALGSLTVARWVDRLLRLDIALGITLLTGSLWLAGSVLGQVLLGDVFQHIHSLNLEAAPAATSYLCLVTLFLVVAVPATFLGAVFPLLLRWASRSLTTLGHDVGRLYASNTVGAIAGSFVSGFVLLVLLGVDGSLLLLAACYGVLSLLIFRHVAPRLLSAAATVAFLTLASLSLARQPIYWFNGGFTCVLRIPKGQTLFLEEGIEATVGVSQLDDVLSLTVNGLIVAENTRHDLWDLLLKAHLPMLLHTDPARVALVGLGAGVSLGAVQAHDTQRIDCIEISPEVERAHRFFGSYNNRCWEDRRLQLWINDGRYFLLTTNRRYDVISVDPVDPPVCKLYSQDFFQLCFDRLDAGGLMVQWVPLFRLSPEHIRVIMRAFLNVFEQTSLWYDGTSVLLIGSRGGPLQVNVEQFLQRAEQPGVQDSLALIDAPSPWLLLSTYVMGPRGVGDLVGSGVPQNTDDSPYLEYAVLRAGRLDRQTMAANLEMLVPYYEPMPRWLLASHGTPENLAKIRRGRQLMSELLQVRIHLLRGDRAQASDRLLRAAERFNLGKRELSLLSPFLEDGSLTD